MVTTPAPGTGPRPAPGPCGLADGDLVELGREVLQCWDELLDVVRSPATDLSRPSRLKGWTGKDVLVHLGSWPDALVMDALLESADAGGYGTTAPPDAGNEVLVAAHRDATADEVVEALVAARTRIAHFWGSDEAARYGRLLSRSTVGPLPVASLVHAGTFELAVHALDLAPCGAPAPAAHLLDRGLAALIDVTGDLAAHSGVEIELTGQTPAGGWAFTSTAHGWTTSRTAPGEFDGVGVRGSAVDLLDAAAGRSNLGQLLLTRRLHVQHMAQWMRLAPLLDDVPGLPGGAALKTAVGGLSGVAGGLSSVAGGLGRALGRFGR
ncbi:MAG: uncharacterized protein JWN08_52 [Frankiales bacterium]|jgi:uncharacterized protein (TIGR03083 family)|nr:uncharacterized protein [Frankiales bacterium]